MIAVNATILGERPTGLGVYARGVISALAAGGEDLEVYTSHVSTLPAAVRIARAPSAVRPERRPLGHLVRLAWLQTALPRRLACSRAATLLNVVPEGPLGCPIPQVMVVHDLVPLLVRGGSPRPYLYFRYVLPLLLRASRPVVADSEATRRDVLARYPRVPADHVHVVYPGYDRDRFNARPEVGPERPGYLLYVGNVAPHKNLIRLVEAFATIAAHGDVRLAIRGSGRPAHVAAVERRIEELDLRGRVDWRPYEDATRLADLYRGARAVVLPSLYEGFGLTALEAMACGAPVIAARASSIPEVVGDAAHLVDPLDTQALTAAMAELLANDGLETDLRRRGPRRAAHFSWDRTARELSAILHAASATAGA
jgi:glycosyltransferase involved in cell wall biosynthesis